MDRAQEPHCKAWEKELPKLKGVSWGSFHTGLAEWVNVDSPRVLRKHEEAIFSAAPITGLFFFVVEIRTGEEIPEAAATLAGCRRLQGLRRLHINGVTRAEAHGIDVLARCPGLAGVRDLDLGESAHDDRFLAYLARCPAWPSVQRLNLYRGWFEPPGLRALATAPLLASLRSLNLSRSHVQSAGLRELLRSPHLAGLRQLELSENGIESRVVKNLVEYPWQRLERLDLSSNELTTAAVRHLAGSPRLASLRSLDLSAGHKLGDDAAAVLAKSPHLGALVDLDLGWWKLTPRGVRALVRAPWLKRIRRLRLCGFHSGREGRELLAAADLPALRWLDLCYSDLGGDDLRPLLAAPWLSQLTHLDLHNNHLGAGGARLLAEAPGLDRLVSLDVTQNEIPDDDQGLLRERFGDRVELKRSWD
jgi:hypothetical protein